MKNIGKLMLGILLIVAGVIIGTNSLEITNINIFFDGWWTLFIIVPSILGLVDRNSNKGSNITGLIIGVSLLLITRDIINLDLFVSLIVPFIFVVIGASMIFNSLVKSPVTNKIKDIYEDDYEVVVSLFSEQKIVVEENDYKGSKLEAVFGSMVFDLSNTKLKQDTIIKTSSIFGSIKILVPKNVNVKIKSTPIFGGVENKITNKKENKKTIYIESLCLFGGLDIK